MNVILLDPAPWIGLNLLLSLQAAYTGPILLISSNRADATRQRVLTLIEEHTLQMDEHMQQSNAMMAELHAMHRRMLVHLQIEVAA